MNPRNYQKELDQIIEGLQEQKKVPKLLIHSCCAPCSSYVLEYLSQYFEITVYFYNPNIYPPLEYIRRVEEQERLINEMKFEHPVTLQTGVYEPEEFYRIVEGYEKEPEGGSRCFRCYELRLQEAAKVAQAGKFDYFTTTLSISPLKNADKLNGIGEKLGKEYRISYLPSDFKKKNGYKRSVELSKEHNLYRQDYCGCVFSQREKQTKESSC
ncbi:epoxyqueuosine reductase QueH [Clostridium boliviensis]|uniref:Epoxyqueuosine reductase QueH n=1 Tax=Clostridium boliviensis TaxID=318465 RepID=A0ABU4GQD5_9CLOT|nr:epoxyqueuosine reductase QueH [Clostridium boliviensis]MDW2799138.1 epoxyqueuosine reductase QueH [Clostridium boliviensis]